MIIHFRADICTIEGASEELIQKLRNRFYYWRQNNDYGNVPEWLKGKQSDKSYLVGTNGTFVSGLLSSICEYFDKNNLSYELRDMPQGLAPTIEQTVEALERMPFVLRGYQLDALEAMITNPTPFGIVAIPTGGGKTVVLAAALAAWNNKSAILVDSKDLFHQLYEELPEITGIEQSEFGRIGASIFRPSTINICMVPTLNRIRKGSAKFKQISTMFKETVALFIDEAHHAIAPSYQKAIKRFKNVHCRYGFTASPVTPSYRNVHNEVVNKNILLEAYLGRPLFVKSMKDLVKEGWLAKPNFYMVKNKLEPIEDGLAYAEEYQRVISKAGDRNSLIASITAEAYYAGKQTIIFVNRIEHGYQISNAICSEYNVPKDDIGYVTGESDNFSRANHIKDFKVGDLPILIGTVLSEGLNFFCDVGIEASAGKSERTCIQRPGRVLRKRRDPETGDVNPDEKAEVDYYDFSDYGHPIFRKQGYERRKIYERQGHELIYIKEEDLLDD